MTFYDRETKMGKSYQKFTEIPSLYYDWRRSLN